MKYFLPLILMLFLIPVPASAKDSSPVLTDRVPHREDLKDYLDYFVSEDLEWWADEPDITYIDLNGDGESDMVVEWYLNVAVLVWIGDSYSKPYFAAGSRGPRFPYSQTEFQDWTGDGIPEVIFEHRIDYSGSYISGGSWNRTIIHCNESECKAAWQGDYGSVYRLAFIEAMESFSQSTMRLDTTQEKPVLEVTSVDFELNRRYGNDTGDSLWSIENAIMYRYELRDDTRTFEILDSMEVASERIHIPAFSNLSISNSTITAEITSSTGIISEGGTDQRIISCALESDPPIEVGSYGSFRCFPEYTRLQLTDMTDDGHDELILLITTDSEYMEFDKEPGRIAGRCINQQIAVFDLQNSPPEEIANVAGCVTQSDLLGVRVEDVDLDNQMEIVSAGKRYIESEGCETAYPGGLCWYELNDQNDVYEWDGSTFVYDRSVPRSPDPILVQSE